MVREAQKKRSKEIRRMILDTTLQMGIEEGFEAISIRKISDRMGYSTGVIYYHFKDKQEIIEEIHQEANEEINKIIKTVYSPDKNFIENTKGIFHEIMHLAFYEKEKFNLIILNKYSKRKESSKPWQEIIEREMLGAIEKGEIRNLDVKKAAFCIWSSFLGFHLMLTQEENIDIKEAEDLFNTMADIMLGSLIK